jgi:hypothetical protein
MWNLFVALLGIGVLSHLYMMTFRRDEWLRLVKDEQERRQERTKKVLKDAFHVAKWWLNK